MHFFYDAQSRPAMVEFNGAVYSYIHNLQGDVVGILDSTGSLVVEYKYDAWGKPTLARTLTTAYETLAELNPFRYRGYIWDSCTELYYLRSRYFAPNMQRFINEDCLILTKSGFAGINVFAYCANNPIINVDGSGCSFWDAVKSAVRTTLHIGNELLVSLGIDTAGIGAFFLDMVQDAKGIYHARVDCWQQYFGYNKFYDFVFDIGTSMQAQNFEFEHDGQSYTLWFWKGDYINLGAGAEAGIYYGSGAHKLVDTSLTLPMSMNLSYMGENIITYSENTWWLTGFNPKYRNVLAENLTATFTIDFSQRTGMYESFSTEFEGATGWSFDDDAQTATFIF